MSRSESATFGIGVSAQGKVQMDERERKALDRFLLTLAGKPAELTVKRARATRSNQQNRFWWGVLVPAIAEHCGYTNDEMHEALKHKFLRLDADPDKHGLVRVRSTATLDTKEFTDLIENVVTWAGVEFGLDIHLPGDIAA
jgi:hypothetical protein